MKLDMYWTALVLLLPTIVLLTGRNLLLRPFNRFTRKLRRSQDTDEQEDVVCCSEKDEEASRFRRIFLQVYLLVMGSEWLQGPYMYTLLRDEKHIDEGTVAWLYATNYIAAAVSALFVGFLADRYGRRAACLAFCAVHTAACLTVLSPHLPVIFVGRVLSGVGLTLLWTVFESWMVTEYNARGLHASSVSLTTMFGIMTTSNCMCAILGGVLGHCLVLALGSRTNPFVLGIALEFVAVYLMFRDWNENYGTTRATPDDEEVQVITEPSTGGSGAFGDIRVWMLSFITCFFEGANFLILYFWPGMLQDAHKRALLEAGTDSDDDQDSEVPYGVVFASFMGTMILGALLFNKIAQEKTTSSSSSSSLLGRLRGLVAPYQLFAAAILVASGSLFLLGTVRSELGIFLSFHLYEACNGVYVPSIAYQRGIIVAESSRTGMYGLMKIPLFVFVVCSLNMAAADDGRRRAALIVAGGTLLLAAVCAAMLKTEGPGTHEKLMMMTTTVDDTEFIELAFDEKMADALDDDDELAFSTDDE